MAVLVTGGAGFIGSHVSRLLATAGKDVVVLDDFSTGRPENLANVPCRIVRGSILDQEVLHSALVGIDEVVHLAALVSVPLSLENPSRTHEINATGTLRVLQASVRAGVRRFVQASTSAVYGAVVGAPSSESTPTCPASPYAATKLAAETYAQAYSVCYGLSTVSLRFFNVYGPHQDTRSPYSGVLSLFLARSLAGEELHVYGDGEQTRDFIAVQDVSRAVLLSLSDRSQTRVFNIGSGTSISLNAVIDVISGVLGRKCRVSYAAERRADIRHSCADIQLAHRQLGFTPSVELRDGLLATIDWVQSGAPAEKLM